MLRAPLLAVASAALLVGPLASDRVANAAEMPGVIPPEDRTAPVITEPVQNALVYDSSIALVSDHPSDPSTLSVSYRWYVDGLQLTSCGSPFNGTCFPDNIAAGAHTTHVEAVLADGSTYPSADRNFVVVLPDAGQPGITIDSGTQYTNSRKVTLDTIWPTGGVRYTDALVSNDGGFRGVTGIPLEQEISWTLLGAGDEKLPKTVYVRFTREDSSQAVSETYTDDIVLDLTVPTGVTASVAGPGAGRQAAGRAQLRLRLRAQDTVSGVAKVQFAAQRGKAIRTARFKALVSAPRATRFVRVLDRAGNASRWIAVRR